ncbi:hypothetical protein AS200_44545 (plasmid) [Streptomyces sp. CdTB01]|nr:hypothetical protein AS200_44545 [Streptomyces sp. CdTB01]
MTQGYVQDATTDGPASPPASAAVRRFRWQRDGMWRRGLVLAIVAVGEALLLLFHSALPNRVGNLGSLLETFLPWLGASVPVLAVCAVLRRSTIALIALLLPLGTWLSLFGGLLADKTSGGGDLTVLTHNVNAANADPVGTARAVAASGADVVALEELTPSAVPAYAKALASTYPYHSVQGTVALWSRYPLHGVKPVDIKLGWTRAMRAVVTTADGRIAVYVAHLPSVRVKFDAGFTAAGRDRSAEALGQAIAREPTRGVVLLGDLNGTVNDRALAPITSQMRSAQGAAGEGFGFSWPARFPVARIDHILVRGIKPRTSWTLAPTGSEHLPVAARLQIATGTADSAARP